MSVRENRLLLSYKGSTAVRTNIAQINILLAASFFEKHSSHRPPSPVFFVGVLQILTFSFSSVSSSLRVPTPTILERFPPPSVRVS